MPRRLPAIESFDPHLKQVWVKAAVSTVTISLPTREQATALRHRLYQLRKVLEANNDPLAMSARYSIIRISQKPNSKEWQVTVSKGDDVFLPFIQQAGIEVEGPPNIDLGDLYPTVEPAKVDHE